MARSLSVRPNRPEQEDHRVPNDRRDRPWQLWLRDTGRRRHARGVWLGNVLQANTHPSGAAEGRPQWTLWVSSAAHDTSSCYLRGWSRDFSLCLTDSFQTCFRHSLHYLWNNCLQNWREFQCSRWKRVYFNTISADTVLPECLFTFKWGRTN